MGKRIFPIKSVNVLKKRRGGLGIVVSQRAKEPFVVISDLVSGGSAALTRRVHVGDALVCVNGVDVSTLDYDDVMQILKDVPCETFVVLLVLRMGRAGLSGIEKTDMLPKILNGPLVSTNRSPVAPWTGYSPFGDSYKHFASGQNLRPPVPRWQKQLPSLHTFPNGSRGQTDRTWTNHKLKQTSDQKMLAYRYNEKIQVTGKHGNHGDSDGGLRRDGTLELLNWDGGKRLKDKLHVTDPSVYTICTKDRCVGSLMRPLTTMKTRPPGVPRSKAETLQQAHDFIRLYYEASNRTDSVEHKQRWNEVMTSLKTSGTYSLTTDELVFGTRTAWRNAPRCIGRIQWNRLEINDARHAKTPHDMYEALCHHLAWSTNGGNLRSLITIFPPRTDGQHDYFVWNAQLIRYAGYRNEDGSTIGDPINIEFTELCQKLGWTGKRSHFDVLPWVLSANGGKPQMFEVPKELVLEIPLKHPTFPWFEELGLQWYAVPAVSDMMLDCGGLEFTAVPFSGWYMLTEIAARNLCDQTRYNILESVAVRMGLDTKTMSSLWRDKAVVEVTLAVLHSFQSANITIVDHHSVSESFIQHMDNEQSLRGGCPADWVWIVPPISGSLTPVFHQEMLSYFIRPSYEYQADPWNLPQYKEKYGHTREKHFTLKAISQGILFANKLIRNMVSKRVKCTIVYASETGRSEKFAQTACHIFGHAFNTHVVCMDDYDIINIQNEALFLVVTSTFGDGAAPENGKDFSKRVHALKEEIRNNGKPVGKKLQNMRFSVFALGSSSYGRFCEFGHEVDDILDACGAGRLHPLMEGDEISGQAKSFRTWAKEVFKASVEEYNIEDPNVVKTATRPLQSDDEWNPDNFRLHWVTLPGSWDVCKALSTLHSRHVTKTRLMERKQLQSSKSSRQSMLVNMKTEDPDDMAYEPGDHLAVYPANKEMIVEAVRQRITNLPPETQAVCTQTLMKGLTGATWATHRNFPSCTIRAALTWCLDITTPPTQDMLRQLASQTTDRDDQEQLLALSKDSKLYRQWKECNMPTFADLLEDFPSLKPCATFVMTQLPVLHPRLYSVSSSRKVHQAEVHATLGVFRYKTQGEKERIHEGVCSSWLNTLNVGDIVPCFIRPAPSFRLPPDISLPVVMVGAGTGIAPFRGFWKQRLHDKRTFFSNNTWKGRGPMTLYFGCRTVGDNMFADELEEVKSEGVIQDVHIALSREPGQPKTYVQDALLQNGDSIYKTLVENQGHLYVCGETSMAIGVTEALTTIFQTFGNMSDTAAKAYIDKMKLTQRFHEDVFGVLFKLPEV